MPGADPDLHAGNVTPPEAAAWQVAVGRGLNISRADLRSLLEAALGVALGHEAAPPGPVPRLVGDDIVMDWRHKPPAR